MNVNKTRLIKILLIEDNEGDILLTTETLDDTQISYNLRVIKDGEAAIDFFGSITNKNDTPDLILLDINLPKKSGHEVLAFIKENDLLKHIQVMMLTTSSSPNDVLLSNKNQVNCYLVKPLEALNFKNIISKMQCFA